MKKYLYASTLLIFFSLLLLQSTSFSTSEMLNKATVSSVPESQALLSVHYGEGRLFWVTNNTENVVQMGSTSNIAPNESFQIGPGRSNSFTIIGHPEELEGSIQLDVEWDGGYAKVESIIPQLNIEQILLELLEEEGEASAEEVELEGLEEVDEQGEVTIVHEELDDKADVEDSSLIVESEMTTEIDVEIGE